MTKMIRASIDIGSNSVLLLAVQWNNKIEKEILNCSHITSLGRDLDKTKMFHPESIQATYDALLDYKNKLSAVNVEAANVIVTATEAARVATNAKDFFAKINNELGFKVQIISGEQEAYFTALGVVSGAESRQNNLVVMDIGGASTELIKIQSTPFKILSSISLPVGSVRGTDWKKSNLFEEKMNEILSNSFSEYQSNTMICVAGSMTSLATMLLGKKEFDDQAIDGLKIDIADFKKFKLSIQDKNASELLAIFPFLGKRAPMVSAGAEVALLILEKLQVEKLQVSTRGLRYGVVFQGHL
jgi:exopolyphosphatase/guanosine-5'-triphosphate,3'-diphosphate pyrophosphatase